eukprot:PhF_6_TR40642/c0_g1_i9/m.61029
MGIEKLLQYLRKHEGKLFSNLTFPNPSEGKITILVDAHGAFHSIVESTPETYQQHPDTDVLGCDPWVYEIGLVRMVERFKAFGVTLVFVIDGSRGVEGVENSRNDTWDKREEERLLESQQRYDYCAGTERNKPKQPCKLLLTSQMKRCLTGLGVECLVLDGEVDVFVGTLLHKYQTPYFMTGDTDFVAMDGVVTILNQLFPWHAFLGTSTPQRVEIPTTKASYLIEFCRLQGLPQLWRVAALAGNDLTKGKLRRSFDGFEDALAAVLSGRTAVGSEEEELMQQSLMFYTHASDPNRTIPTPKNT